MSFGVSIEEQVRIAQSGQFFERGCDAPTACPPDCEMPADEWLTLSPGFRREIWRDWVRRSGLRTKNAAPAAKKQLDKQAVELRAKHLALGTDAVPEISA